MGIRDWVNLKSEPLLDACDSPALIRVIWKCVNGSPTHSQGGIT